MNIREKKEALLAIVNDAQVMLLDLRKECPHMIGEYIYKGDSGNWSSSDDSYWKELTCSDCGKRWVEDHKIDGVRNPAYHTNPEGMWRELR